MKKIFLTTLLLNSSLFVLTFSQQGISVNTTGNPPHPSAVLDVSSTTQGALVPRMTIAQRNAIVSPAEGLIIYNLDCKDLNIYNGTNWIGLTLSPTTALTATGVAGTSFTANWTNINATNYFLDVSTSPLFATFVPGYNNLNVGSGTSFNVTGLTCGTTYYYRVRAQFSCAATGNSNTISVTPPCCISNYSVASIPYTPYTNTGTTIALGDDQVSALIPIGFTFSFYCNNYTSVAISSNGFITFNGASGSGCCGGQFLPNAADPNNLIAGGWDDLYPPGAGTIRYTTQGTAPNRRFVVNYDNIPFCCGTTPAVSFQIVIYETTNIIEIYGANYSGITPGTIGVENIGGTIATTPPGRNSAAWTSTNEAWRFF